MNLEKIALVQLTYGKGYRLGFIMGLGIGASIGIIIAGIFL